MFWRPDKLSITNVVRESIQLVPISRQDLSNLPILNVRIGSTESTTSVQNKKRPGDLGVFLLQTKHVVRLSRRRLKDVCDEVVAPVIAARRWIVVVPLLVVDRDSHLWRIAMVQVVGASVVLVAPVILWVSDVRVVIESVEVL